MSATEAQCVVRARVSVSAQRSGFQPISQIFEMGETNQMLALALVATPPAIDAGIAATIDAPPAPISVTKSAKLAKPTRPNPTSGSATSTFYPNEVGRD